MDTNKATTKTEESVVAEVLRDAAKADADNWDSEIYLEFFDEHHSFLVPIRGLHDDSGMLRIEGMDKEWYRIRKSLLSDYRFSFLGADWRDVAVVGGAEAKAEMSRNPCWASIIPWSFAWQFFCND